MDLGYLKFTGQFKKYDFWQLKYWTAISISISKYIISVSENTKKDIVRHYNKSSNKVIVVHHGYDKARFNTNIRDYDVRRVKKTYGITGDYILFLSTLKPSKNIEGIIDAYYKICSYNKDISVKLVIAGKKGWLFNSIFKKVKDLNLGKKVIFTDFIEEKDKPALLSGATLLISPSFWEGFGMHILESLACGTPVVISNVASIPEVVGGAGVFVNPESPESISKGIIKVLSMKEEEYNKIVKMGIKQADKYSWKKCARETIRILEKAVK
jgi:glycosyltransferase involved in cell wall biosynthesis